MKKRELSSIPCPIEYTIELLSGKWKMHVIWQVAKQEVIRFNELRRQLNGISNVMLTQTLQELQEAGVINRNQYNEVPPRVEYSLTGLGKGLLPVFEVLETWGKRCGWANPDRLS
jgi:DNA-binding HxlR family transcriptional regulator